MTRRRRPGGVRWELDAGGARWHREQDRDDRAAGHANGVCAALELCGQHVPFERDTYHEPPLVRREPCESCGGSVAATKMTWFTDASRRGSGRLVAGCDSCGESYSIAVSEESLPRALEGYTTPSEPPPPPREWDQARERFFPKTKGRGDDHGR